MKFVFDFQEEGIGEELILIHHPGVSERLVGQVKAIWAEVRLVSK